MPSPRKSVLSLVGQRIRRTEIAADANGQRQLMLFGLADELIFFAPLEQSFDAEGNFFAEALEQPPALEQPL